MKSFSEQLFQLRHKKKLLQKQVAYGAGIDPSYLAALEKDRRDPPRPKLLERLLESLGATNEESNLLRSAAALGRLQCQVARQKEIIPGVEVALRVLEVAPMLCVEELAALNTLLMGLRARPNTNPEMERAM